MHLNTSYLKTRLIDTLGEKPTAIIQAVHFVHLLRTHRRVTPEATLLPALLHEGETAIDVGANGADWTYWLERRVGRTGHVYAFEADPYYALATRYAIRILRLKCTELFPFGLSDSDEEAPLCLVDSEGLRTFGISHIEKHPMNGGKNVQMVRLRRLDSMTDEYPLLLDAALIKCDTEGYELFVFRGADAILDHSRPSVILEVRHCEEQGYRPEDLFNFFRDRGYASFAMVADRTLAPTDAAMGQKNAITINRVLLPLEKLERLGEQIRFLS